MSLRVRFNNQRVFDSLREADPYQKFIPGIIEFLGEHARGRLFEGVGEIREMLGRYPNFMEQRGLCDAGELELLQNGCNGCYSICFSIGSYKELPVADVCP
jgi:hypothetical protein